MRISPINYSLNYSNKVQNQTFKKPVNNFNSPSVQTNSITFGDMDHSYIDPPKIRIRDNKGIFEYEDISDSKVGEKFLLHPTDPKYKDLTILFTPKTTMSTPDSSLSGYSRSDVCPVSFKGQVWGSVRKDENGTDEVMKKAYDDFFRTGMNDHVTYVERSNEASKIKDDYNFFVPSDGDGTRYRDITKLQGGVTKPASRIPAKLNGYDMRLVHGVLVNFAKTSKLEDGANFVEVKPAQGSAYALLEGLASGNIPTDKPIVFSWGDNFSDIDITKLILDHEKNNSGFTMLVLPVNEERVKSIGAAKVKSADDLEMLDFFEKPTDPETIEKFRVSPDEDKFLGVVGPYVLSPQVLSWLKEGYINNQESFKDETKGYDFSSKIIGQLIEPMNNGEIEDENGNPLRMYAYEKPETDSWSDLGSEKDFSREIKNVKHGGFQNLPIQMRESISQNVDRYGNITFDEKTKRLLQDFLDEYEIDLRNAIVYSN